MNWKISRKKELRDPQTAKENIENYSIETDEGEEVLDAKNSSGVKDTKTVITTHSDSTSSEEDGNNDHVSAGKRRYKNDGNASGTLEDLIPDINNASDDETIVGGTRSTPPKTKETRATLKL